MIIHHTAKLGGHRDGCGRFILFLVIEEQYFTSSLNSTITVCSAAVQNIKTGCTVTCMMFIHRTK